MFQRIMVGLLAAAAILPGAAMAQDRDGRGRDRIERQDRGDRGGRGGDRGDWQRPARDRGEVRRDDRGEARRFAGRGDDRNDRGGWDRGRGNDGRYDRGDRYAGQRWNGQRWNGGWRQDRRYNWAGYRNANRNAFRLPRYYAPGGWNYGYRRFGIGTRIAASLFASSYWIADPWAYRLPPAYGPYRWVRYYGDALLIDTRTGYTMDVIHDIFW
jgi:hypothetical protein